MSWAALPVEAKLGVCRYLDFPDLCQLSQASRADRQVAHSAIGLRYLRDYFPPGADREKFEKAWTEATADSTLTALPEQKESFWAQASAETEGRHRRFYTMLDAAKKNTFFAKQLLYYLRNADDDSEKPLDILQRRWLAWCVFHIDNRVMQDVHMELIVNETRDLIETYRSANLLPFILSMRQLKEDIQYLINPDNLSAWTSDWLNNAPFKRVMTFYLKHYNEMTALDRQQVARTLFRNLGRVIGSLFYAIQNGEVSSTGLALNFINGDLSLETFDLSEREYNYLANPPANFLHYLKTEIALLGEALKLRELIDSKLTTQDEGNYRHVLNALYNSLYLPANWHSCPREVKLQILSFCGFDGLCAVSTVNREFRDLSQEAVVSLFQNKTRPDDENVAKLIEQESSDKKELITTFQGIKAMFYQALWPLILKARARKICAKQLYMTYFLDRNEEGISVETHQKRTCVQLIFNMENPEMQRIWMTKLKATREATEMALNQLGLLPFVQDKTLLENLKILCNQANYSNRFADVQSAARGVLVFYNREAEAILASNHQMATNIIRVLSVALQIMSNTGVGIATNWMTALETIERAKGSLGLEKYTLITEPQYSRSFSYVCQRNLELSKGFSEIEERLERLVLDSARVQERSDVNYKLYAYPHLSHNGDFKHLHYALTTIVNERFVNPSIGSGSNRG